MIDITEIEKEKLERIMKSNNLNVSQIEFISIEGLSKMGICAEDLETIKSYQEKQSLKKIEYENKSFDPSKIDLETAQSIAQLIVEVAILPIVSELRGIRTAILAHRMAVNTIKAGSTSFAHKVEEISISAENVQKINELNEWIDETISGDDDDFPELSGTYSK